MLRTRKSLSENLLYIYLGISCDNHDNDCMVYYMFVVFFDLIFPDVFLTQQQH